MATASAITDPRISAEQFFRLSDWERCELVDGELVELPIMSVEGCTIATVIASLLNLVVRPAKLGIVVDSEVTYQCFADDPDRIRRPDVSYIAKGRLPREQYERGHCRIAPDIAIEVLSPNDSCYTVDAKVEEYLAAGVRLVWVINPETHTVTVSRPDGSTDRLRRGGTLTGESVLPQFSVFVDDLFPNPDEVL